LTRRSRGDVGPPSGGDDRRSPWEKVARDAASADPGGVLDQPSGSSRGLRRRGGLSTEGRWRRDTTPASMRAGELPRRRSGHVAREKTVGAVSTSSETSRFSESGEGRPRPGGAESGRGSAEARGPLSPCVSTTSGRPGGAESGRWSAEFRRPRSPRVSTTSDGLRQAAAPGDWGVGGSAGALGGELVSPKASPKNDELRGMKPSTWSSSDAPPRGDRAVDGPLAGSDVVADPDIW
jgi:hypothetical protein